MTLSSASESVARTVTTVVWFSATLIVADELNDGAALSSAAAGVSDSSALHGPSPASLAARTRTVYSVLLVRPVISWVVASAAAVADCPAVAASAQVWAAVFHSTS